MMLSSTVAPPTGFPSESSNTLCHKQDRACGVCAAQAANSPAMSRMARIVTRIWLPSPGFSLWVPDRTLTYARSSPNATIRAVFFVLGAYSNPAGAAGLKLLRAFSPSHDAAGNSAPSDLEGRAAAKHFLRRYLIYTPDSIDRNFTRRSA